MRTRAKMKMRMTIRRQIVIGIKSGSGGLSPAAAEKAPRHATINSCLSSGTPPLTWMLDLTDSKVSDASTSNMMLLPLEFREISSC